MNEIWKDIEGYEGFYQVSNLGRIKSFVGYNGHEYVNRVRILNPYKQKAGKTYNRSVVKLRKNGLPKDFKVHQLVANAFLPNPKGLKVINHIDGNPLNNEVSNLEWCTQKCNIRHSIDSGMTVRTIHSIDRDTMISFLNNGFNYDEIASELGIAKGTVHNYIKKFGIKKKYY